MPVPPPLEVELAVGFCGHSNTGGESGQSLAVVGTLSGHPGTGFVVARALISYAGQTFGGKLEGQCTMLTGTVVDFGGLGGGWEIWSVNHVLCLSESVSLRSRQSN